MKKLGRGSVKNSFRLFGPQLILRENKIKVRLAPPEKVGFACFEESPLKMIEQVYFILKALFVFKTFKFYVLFFFLTFRKTAWQESQGFLKKVFDFLKNLYLW